MSLMNVGRRYYSKPQCIGRTLHLLCCADVSFLSTYTDVHTDINSNTK